MIELHPDLSKLTKVLERIADAHERIADALDRAVPKYEIDPIAYEDDEIKKDSKALPFERNEWDDFAPRRNY